MLLRLSRRTPANPQPWRPPLPLAVRISALLAGLALAALLVVAALLTPDPAGFGTHRQLGCPPCTVWKLFHIRCPVCGMTTAWAYTVRGQLWSAATVNCGGLLLAVLSILSTPWLLVGAVRGRWPGGEPSGTVVFTLAACVVGVILLDWSVRLLAP